MGHGHHRSREQQLCERHRRRSERRGNRQRRGLHSPRHRSQISMSAGRARSSSPARRPLTHKRSAMATAPTRRPCRTSTGTARTSHRRSRRPINGIGIAGVAPDATIVAIKACTVVGFCFADSVVGRAPLRGRPTPRRRQPQLVRRSVPLLLQERRRAARRSCVSWSPQPATHSSAAW